MRRRIGIVVSTLLEILDTPLHLACYSENANTVSTLLEILGLVCAVLVGF